MLRIMDAKNLYRYVTDSTGSADVRIYRNLHQKCWSVQTKTATGWRVLCHAVRFNGTQATFRVSEAGRLRTINNRTKNVHAYCYVTLRMSSHILQDWISATSYVSISYNPYRAPSFVSTPMLPPHCYVTPRLEPHYTPIDSAQVIVGRSDGRLEGAS